MSLQDGIGFAYQGHKIVIELINEETNDMTGQCRNTQKIESQASPCIGTCRTRDALVATTHTL